MNGSQQQAPGWPGIRPRWTSSAKYGLGTAVGRESRVWFTVSHGIVNEVYYPRLDQANTRDFGLLVADGSNFFSEEKRHTVQEIRHLAPGVPGYRLTNTCVQGRYRILKTVLTDPRPQPPGHSGTAVRSGSFPGGAALRARGWNSRPPSAPRRNGSGFESQEPSSRSFLTLTTRTPRHQAEWTGEPLCSGHI